jgi:hypothetical protein
MLLEVFLRLPYLIINDRRKRAHVYVLLDGRFNLTLKPDFITQKNSAAAWYTSFASSREIQVTACSLVSSNSAGRRH